MTVSIMQEVLQRVDDEFLGEILEDQVESLGKARTYLRRFFAAAACLVLLLSAVQAYRYDYFRSGCGALIGEIQNGVYYYVIPHRGLYAYEPECGKRRILKSPDFDDWLSAPQGICYSSGSNLFFYSFAEENSRLLCEFDKGSFVYLEMVVGEALGVTEYRSDGGEIKYLVKLADGTREQHLGIDFKRRKTVLPVRGTLIAETQDYLFYVKEQGSSPQNIYCYDCLRGGSHCILENVEVYTAVTDGDFFYLCTPWRGGNVASYRMLKDNEGVPTGLEMLEENIMD